MWLRAGNGMDWNRPAHDFGRGALGGLARAAGDGVQLSDASDERDFILSLAHVVTCVIGSHCHVCYWPTLSCASLAHIVCVSLAHVMCV